MKKVLILGAGLVVKPMVEYLLQNRISVMVASPIKDNADRMIKGISSEHHSTGRRTILKYLTTCVGI